MRKSLGIVLLVVFIILGTSWIYRLEIASSLFLKLCYRFGIREVALIVGEFDLQTVTFKAVHGCYPISGADVCVTADEAKIHFKVDVAGRRLRPTLVEVTNGALAYSPDSDLTTQLEETKLPLLPLILELPTISFHQNLASRMSSVSPMSVLVGGVLASGTDGTSVELVLLDSNGRRVEVSGESSEKAPLSVKASLGGQQVATFSVSDHHWKQGTLHLHNLHELVSYAPWFFISDLVQRRPVLDLKWRRSKAFGVIGEVQWREPDLVAHRAALEGVVDLDQPLPLDLKIHHPESKLSGNFTLRCRNSCADGRVRLKGSTQNQKIEAQKLPFLRELPLTVSTGGVTYSIEKGWGKKASNLSLVVGLKSVAMSYRELNFGGVSGKLRVLPLFKWIDDLRVQSIDLPIPVKNLATRASLVPIGKEIGLRLLNTRGEILGGSFAIKDISFGAENASGVLQFSAIQLGELLSLHKQEFIRATGTISGEIPFSLSSTGFSVTKGTLKSDGQGTIEYVGEPVPGGLGVAASVADKALRNFHYSLITADLLYEPDGDALIKARLEGTSPLLNTSRPVIVNLNLQENMLDLLRTLRISQEIEREVRNLW